MSEKRYEIDVDHLLLVWDTEKNKRLEIEDIVDLLNEQQVQIKVYEKSLIRKSKKISEQQATISRLEEENERLRSLHIDLLETIVKEPFYQEIFKEFLLENPINRE